MGQQFEAVFENGVFRPLQPVVLPEHQRVTLHIPDGGAGKSGDLATDVPGPNANQVGPDQEEDVNANIAYLPLPLRECQTIGVKLRYVGDMPPVPYPVAEDDLE